MFLWEYVRSKEYRKESRRCTTGFFIKEKIVNTQTLIKSQNFCFFEKVEYNNYVLILLEKAGYALSYHRLFGSRNVSYKKKT